MKRKNPMKGLLVLSYYASTWALISAFFTIAIFTSLFLIFGGPIWFNVLVFMGTLNLSTQVLFSLAGADATGAGKWERFQLTMPIRRFDLIKVQYIVMFLSVIISAVIFIPTIIGSYFLHDNMFTEGILRAIVDTSYIFGTPLIMAGTVNPLMCTKFAKGKEPVIMLLCMGLAMGLNIGIPHFGTWLGLSAEILPLAVLGMSFVIFVISYFISKVQFAKIDF